MFVSKAACGYLVHLTILHFNGLASSKDDKVSSTQVTMVLETVKMLITKRKDMALEFLSTLLENNSLVGQEILHSGQLLELCLSSFVAGKAEQVQSLIDFVAVMISNTR